MPSKFVVGRSLILTARFSTCGCFLACGLLAHPGLAQSAAVGSASTQAPVEATSLHGELLYRSTLPAEFVIEQTRHLEEARRASAASPGAVEPLIWIGRRTAYLGRYNEAVAVFSDAIAAHPEDARLYRHRGHRQLTLRRLDLAIADFERGVQLTDGKPDIVEPDGLPNAAGVPTSTLQSNLWYHLGLAHFVKGEFAAAETAYEQGLAVSATDDHRVATSYWLYLSLTRQGKSAAARKLLDAIDPKLELIENQDYHRLLMLFAGKTTVETLLGSAADDQSLRSATLRYGIGAWHLLRGDEAMAVTTWHQLMSSSQWSAFGYLAAEAELARRN